MDCVGFGRVVSEVSLSPGGSGWVKTTIFSSLISDKCSGKCVVFAALLMISVLYVTEHRVPCVTWILLT